MVKKAIKKAATKKPVKRTLTKKRVKEKAAPIPETLAPKPKAKRKPKDPAIEAEKNSKHMLALLKATPSKNLPGKNLADELENLTRKHIAPDKRKDSEKEILELVLVTVDRHGLSSGEILSMMRDLQQAVKMRPGFLKVLENLEADYNAAQPEPPGGFYA